MSPAGNSDNIYIVKHSRLYRHDFDNRHRAALLFNLSLSHALNHMLLFTLLLS